MNERQAVRPSRRAIWKTCVRAEAELRAGVDGHAQARGLAAGDRRQVGDAAEGGFARLPALTSA